MTVSVLGLFLKVSWFGLRCVTVAFPGHADFFIARRAQVGSFLNSVYAAWKKWYKIALKGEAKYAIEMAFCWRPMVAQH